MDEKATPPQRKVRVDINSLIIILIGLGLVSLVAVGSYYLFSKKSPTSTTLKSLTPTATPKPGDPSTYALPLPFTHPNVANGIFYYTIGGDVKTVSSDRITLVSKDSKNDLPSFPITSETKIILGDTTPAGIADILIGKFVYVSAHYDLTTRSWTTTQITVYK